MRRIVSGMFTSLDGVVSADDDWQFRWFDEEVFASLAAAWARADCAVMGRRSFEGYRSLRTDHPDSPMLAFLEGVERYVVSTTVQDPGWPGTTVLRESAYEAIDRIRRSPGRDVLVAGSPSLVRGLLAHGLLDELGLLVLPIVVGPGDRLFGPDQEDLARFPLDLHASRVLGSGAVELTYRPARA